MPLGTGIAQSVFWQVGPGLECRCWQENFLFSRTTRLAPQPTQPHIRVLLRG